MKRPRAVRPFYIDFCARNGAAKRVRHKMVQCLHSLPSFFDFLEILLNENVEYFHMEKKGFLFKSMSF